MPDMPMGGVQNIQSNEGELVVAYASGDTVRMWISSMTGHLSSMGNERSLDMSRRLNKPFVATIRDGVFTIVSAPQKSSTMNIPSSDLEDAAEQYPIVIRLPKGALTKGTTWADTVDRKTPGDALPKLAMHEVTRHTVVADSVMYGVPVVIIETVSDNDTDIVMTAAEGQVTVNSNTKMTTKRRRYYSPAYHVSFLDISTGTGTGKQEMVGPTSMTMNSTQKMELRTALIR